MNATGAPSLYIVDVFAERPYAGNQLAVVVGAGDWDTARMQEFAHEMNFSETTFVGAAAPQGGPYDVRIFTPACEMPFAGHPTLGTAWVIRRFLQDGRGEDLTLRLGVGPIAVRFEQAEHGELVWLTPNPPVLGAPRATAPIAATLGIPTEAIDATFPCVDASVGVEFILLPLVSLEALRALAPAQVPTTASGKGTGVLCFCRGSYDGGADLAARMFFDAYGVREDPATGSANACLAAYLSEQRYLGGETVRARVQQGYELDRPSCLYLHADDPRSVRVGGKVVLVASGKLA